MSVKPVLLSFFVASIVTTTFACNGCSIKKFTAKPCESQNVIHFHLDSLVLASDCSLKPRGWLNITKSVKKLDTKWSFQKGPIKKSGEMNGCEELGKASKDKESAPYIRTFGMPEKCPAEKANKRLNKNVDLSKYKQHMHFLNGPMSAKLDVDHGSAGRTCYNIDALVECKK